MKAKTLSVLASTVLILIMAFSLSAAGKMQGKSSKVQDREAAFRAELEANSFIVNDGYTYPIDPITDLLDSKLGDTANANNPGQPYNIFMIWKNIDQGNLDRFSPILITVLEDHDLEKCWKAVAGLTFWICHGFSATDFDGYLPSCMDHF